ncbi:MAG: flagellar assembly protein FliW [Alphaproteobacteria bacterium]|jgi:flagellar assembly factor FliW
MKQNPSLQENIADLSAINNQVLQETREDLENNQGVYTVKSNFGDLQVNPQNKIHFPNGLIGMKYVQNFSACEISLPNMELFRILQCLDNNYISFLTLPVDPSKTSYYTKEELAEVAKSYEIEVNDLVLVLIASFNKNEKDKVTFNAKAPIFIDTAKKLAYQCILDSHKYKLNETLNNLFA